MKLLKPLPVGRGAKCAVVSLASSFQPDRLTRGVAALQAMGFHPILTPHVSDRSRPYFAGTPEDRLADLHASFADPEISFLICSRGGYGSNYILSGLDLDLISHHPKPLIGYSDMTNLQCWLLDQIGLPVFHGAMVAADFAFGHGVDEKTFLAALSGERYAAGPAEGLRVLRAGKARGVLYGGCLTLLTASLGTPYAVKTEGKLLFLEDVGAKPYQVDRMLRQLLLAGKLEGVSGIIFGEMLDCVSPGADQNLIDEAILTALKDFSGPIATGLRSGHVSRGNVTLTFGVEAELDLSSEPRLRILEPAVERQGER